MKEPEIRDAVDNDLPRISELAIELAGSLDSNGNIDSNLIHDNCRELIKKENSFVIIAEIEGNVIGFVNFSLRLTILHKSPSALIDELVVTKNFRGKGIGRLLVESAVKKAAELGCCEIEVGTENTNTAARNFYKACGFEDNAALLEKDL